MVIQPTMTNFKVDVTILSSQKGLGLPPRLSLVLANPPMQS
jgi:aspartate aminotransferase-like enzyme